MQILDGERIKGPESENQELENLERSLSSAPPIFSPSFQKKTFSAVHIRLWEKAVPHIYVYFNLGKSVKQSDVIQSIWKYWNWDVIGQT